MLAALGILALLAAALAGLAVLLGADPTAVLGMPGGGLKTAGLDWFSFALGFISGLAAFWLARLPWSAIPRALVALLMGWRRNAVLMTFAVVSAGVLLFY